VIHESEQPEPLQVMREALNEALYNRPVMPVQFLAILETTSDLVREAPDASGLARQITLNYEAKLLAACMGAERDASVIATEMLARLKKLRGYQPSLELTLALERAVIHNDWNRTLAEPVLRHLFT
jgi:hypothetical protein